MANVPYVSPYAEDDEQSLDGHLCIYRVVLPREIEWERERAGGPDIASRACQDLTTEKAASLGYPAPAMSIDFAWILEEHGEDPVSIIDNYFGRDHGLVALTVGGIRQVTPAVGIVADPLDGRASHGMVFAHTRLRFNKSQRKQLREAVVGWAFIPERP